MRKMKWLTLVATLFAVVHAYSTPVKENALTGNKTEKNSRLDDGTCPPPPPPPPGE